MQQLGFLVAPLVPLVCLALVLWLDRLEESLDTSPASSAGLDPIRASPAGESSPAFTPSPSPAPALAIPTPEGSAAD